MSERNIVRYTVDEIEELIRRGEDRTDWERVRNMTDEEVEANIDREDEGHFDLSKGFSTSGPPLSRTDATEPHVDADILAWFGRRGSGRTGEINDVLRAYIEEQEQRQAS